MADASSREQRTEMQYDALAKKSLGNERKNFFRDEGNRRKRETLFSEMDEGRLYALGDPQALEAFELIDSGFQVRQYTVAVQNGLLHDALSRIDGQARDVILMAFWLKMSDGEIADETGISRRTVNSIKRRAYEKLKKILEAQGHGAGDFFPGQGI